MLSKITSRIVRTPYIQTPHLFLPILRGWCLLPILIAHTFILAKNIILYNGELSRLIYEFLFEVHLFFAILFHISPVRRWELYLGRIDRVLVIATGTIMATVCVDHSIVTTWTSPSVMVLGLTVVLTSMSRDDTVNLFANIMAPLVCIAVLLTLPPLISGEIERLNLHILYNILGTLFASMFYVIETFRMCPLRSQWIGWHDIFHIVISFVYTHRFMMIHPRVFTHFL